MVFAHMDLVLYRTNNPLVLIILGISVRGLLPVPSLAVSRFIMGGLC